MLSTLFYIGACALLVAIGLAWLYVAADALAGGNPFRWLRRQPPP